MEQERPPAYAPNAALLNLPTAPSGPLPATRHPTDHHDQQPLQYSTNAAHQSPQLSPRSAQHESMVTKSTLKLPRVPTHDPRAPEPVMQHALPQKGTPVPPTESDDRTAAEALLGLGKAQQQQHGAPGNSL